jgi:hypothetical protein
MRTNLGCKLYVLLLRGTIGCQRFKDARAAAHFSILDSDTACGETGYHTLEIELLAPKTAGRAIVNLNEKNLGWEALAARLHDLYSVRQEKFVYLRIQPGLNDSDQSEMFHLIEKAGTERLCLLDFKSPHKYTKQVIPLAQ